jgi:thioesterase domain-containing protein/acyl carrier protein
LIGYAVPNGAPLALADLQAHLRARLPAPALPSALVVLDALPLTPNGKLDRRALPAPLDVAEGRPHIDARTPLERDLAAVFRDVLGVAQVSTDASFFDLGGHSLLAVRLTTALHAKLGIELPLRALFDAPTVEQLATYVTRQPSSAPGPERALVPIEVAAGRPPVFWVHPIGGTVLCYRELARSLAPEYATFAFEAQGVSGQGAPRASIEEMARAYVAELREVQPSGPYRLGGFSLGGIVAFEMARQLRAAGEVVAKVVLLDAAPQPLGADPEALTEDALQAHFDADIEALFAGAGSASAPQVSALFDVFCANARASAGYQPAVYDGDVALVMTPEGASAIASWREVARGTLTCETVPTTHYELMRAPEVTRVASLVLRALRGPVLEDAHDL